MCIEVLVDRHGAPVRREPGRLDVAPRVGIAWLTVEDVVAQVVEFSFDIGRNDACWGPSDCGEQLRMPMIISPSCRGHAT